MSKKTVKESFIKRYVVVPLNDTYREKELAFSVKNKAIEYRDAIEASMSAISSVIYRQTMTREGYILETVRVV